MVQLSATPAAEEIRYRIDSQVPWLRVDGERGTFTGVLARMITIDREGLAPGPHDGAIVVRTTVGDVTIPVHVEQELTGAYAGSLEYSEPRELGASFLRIEVFQEGAFARVRVDPKGSPLFPAQDVDGIGGAEPLTATATVGENGVLEGSFQQTFTPSDFGADAIFTRTVGHQFRFRLFPGPNGGLGGTFEDRWYGLLPSVVVLSGHIMLGRQVGTAVASFDVATPASLPANPSSQPPPITNGCRDAAAAASGQAADACSNAGQSAGLATCAQTMRTRGAALETNSGLLVGDPSRGYSSYETACSGEWVPLSAVPAPSQTGATCIQRGNLACSSSLFGALVQRGLESGSLGITNVVIDYAGIGLFMINAHLVDAFELPYKSSNSPTLAADVVAELSSARQYGIESLSVLFDPFVLETLRTAPTAVTSATEHAALRRLAELVTRTRMASEEKTLLEVRRGLAPSTQLQTRIWRDGVNLIASMGALATIESQQGVPPSAELQTLADALTQTSRRFMEVHDRVAAFGVPEGYVPFIYDPFRPEPTNFEQNLAEADTVIAGAIAAEQIAQQQTRAFEQQVSALSDEITRVQQQYNQRLGGICGFQSASPSEPDLANCGAANGEMAVARAQYEASRTSVRIALERASALDARVELHYRRLADIQRVNTNLIQFVNRNGMQINALDFKSSQLEFIKDAISLASSGSLFNPGGFVAGAAVMGISMKQLEIQTRRAGLALAQEIEPLRAGNEKGTIDALTTIKEMLLGEAELNLEIAQAMALASAAAIQIRNLEQEAEALEAEMTLNVARLTDVTRPLANNASFRVLRNEAVLAAIAAREEAKRKTYLAALAFEFETNVNHPAIESVLIPALRVSDVQSFANSCLRAQYGTFRQTYGARQSFVDEVSLREDILGIRGDIMDPVTGETVTEIDQFRNLLLAPSNRRSDGAVTISFATGLGAGNGVFSTATCNDQIRSIQVRLIGDALGDDQASVHLEQRGSSFQRSCAAYRGNGEDVVNEYVIPDAQNVRAVIHAGVSAYPMSVADTQFAGRSVAASRWTLSIPSGSVEPRNGDVDVRNIEDIVFRIEHSAITINTSGQVFAPACQ